MALPVFLLPPAPQDATLGAILSWVSVLLHGIIRSPCQRHLDRRHLSGGLIPLQRMGWRESTSVRLPGSAPWCCQGSAIGSHTNRYGAARRFSQPHSGLLPLPTVPRFSRGRRSWGSPYRGLCLPRSPDDSSPPAYPLDVAPEDCAVPVLGGDILGRAAEYLGWFSDTFDRLQGLRLRGNWSALSPTINVRQPTCPS